MKYIKIKREDNVCNICQEVHERLSEDHVPPKGGIDLTSMEVVNYCNNPTDLAKNRIMQNGIKFRTLCNKCNNLLGSKYDSCFNQLMKDTKDILINSESLDPIIKLETYPTKIIKSILGHILASKVDKCNTTFDSIIREYVFDDNSILPPNFNIYYWPFTYNCTIIMTDNFLFIPGKGRFYYAVLKTFPLGFIVSFEGEFFGLDNLMTYNNNNLNEKKIIELHTQNITLPFNFPEICESEGVKLRLIKTNDIIAIPRKNN